MKIFLFLIFIFAAPITFADRKSYPWGWIAAVSPVFVGFSVIPEALNHLHLRNMLTSKVCQVRESDECERMYHLFYASVASLAFDGAIVLGCLTFPIGGLALIALGTIGSDLVGTGSNIAKWVLWDKIKASIPGEFKTPELGTNTIRGFRDASIANGVLCFMPWLIAASYAIIEQVIQCRARQTSVQASNPS